VSDELLVSREGRVLIAQINRPDRMNALGSVIHDDLIEAWKEADADPGVRAIVITGTGDRAFCTGMDLREVSDRGEHLPLDPDVHAQMKVTPLNCDVWKPTIVAVNGVCAGAGFHFIADADVVVAADTASFVDTHVSVGQVAAVEPITLAPRIGLGNALRLAILGRDGRLDAAEALRISLVDEVVPADALLARAVALGEAAASGSPAAVEATKRAIRGILDAPLHAALQSGWERLVAHRDHPDAIEGPRAFVERRAPQWAQA
jgi:enoyl-CoA hydratase/carnithine racemase